jgi:N-acetylmuramoyl-L-alanine amidase
VFYLSLPASRQESSRLHERIYQGGGDGGGTLAAKDLAFILADLRLEEGMILSGLLAQTVAREMERLSKVDVRHIKQAGFQVLKLNGVPAVLVEIGFFSNAEEARRISDPRFGDKVAEALARAVIDFVHDSLRARPSRVGPLAQRGTL